MILARPNDMSISNKKLVGVLGRKIGSVDPLLEILRLQEMQGLKSELNRLF